MSKSTNQELLIAYDFGLKRIGIATGNLLTRTATPLNTLIVSSELPWDALDNLIDEWNPAQLIVGLPNPNQSGTFSTKADSFADHLEKRYLLAVSRVDESFTSRAAESRLREYRASGFIKKRIKKAQIDSQAACLIAEQWMNSKLDENTSNSL